MKKVTAAPIVATASMSTKQKAVLKYDAQVPRYTSYPTAPHFTSAINGDVYAKWLENLPAEENLSLYLHIPFCQQMCWYCGCYTKVTKRYAPVENYAHILAREIRLVAGQIGGKKRRISNIHFGGGSPTILLGDTFDFLMQTIRNEFEILPYAEIAIEVDPRNISEEKIAAYAKNKVNRVSIGVQDFNLEVQRAINREQSFELVYDCIKLFRKHGINDINLDLIYGLPKQNSEMLKRNIDYAMLLKPSRVALFSYAHVPWMKKHMRLINENDLPSNVEKIAMYQMAAEKFLQENYAAVGLDHFAKKDDEMVRVLKEKKLKRNFQGYSTDKANIIIAFGASAISFLPQGYVQNICDFDAYEKNILAKKFPTTKGIEISKEDRLRKKIIDELMCYMEVDLKKICAKFSLEKNYFKKEIESLTNLESEGLVTIKNNVIKVDSSFPQISRIVASFFDSFFQKDGKRHSKIA